MPSGKTILLIVTGGIAAYKSLVLVRRLRERGATVRTVLTAAGEKFVTPLSVSALSHEQVYTDLFSLTDEAEMGHLRLSQEADLIVVAPATADILAKMANGLADDLASTVLLAADAPVLVAPAMNRRMWRHPATVANMAALEARGVLRIGPEDGPLAEDESGPGRMAEPEDILAAIEAALGGAARRPLAGRRALVTSGPTFEAIDPVRFIGNRSSGKQGPRHRRGALGARGPKRSSSPGRSRWPIRRGSRRSMSKARARCWRPARRPCRRTSRSAPPPFRTGGSGARPAGS